MIQFLLRRPIAVFMAFTACFLLGQPLLLSYIAREGYKTAPFIAGRNGGLTLINQVLHEQ